MKINKDTTPPNTRFLYQQFLSSGPTEDFLVEWSPSGNFAHLKKRGWVSSAELAQFRLLEILPSLTYNAVCNDPDLIETFGGEKNES